MSLSESSPFTSSDASSASSTSPSSSFDLSSFLAHHSHLLSQEHQEEAVLSPLTSLTRRQRVTAGLCLSKLHLVDVKSGLYGRCLVTFALHNEALLPITSLHVRDVVSIECSAASASPWWSALKGVLYRVTDSMVSISIDAYPEQEVRVGMFALEALPNDATHQRCQQALTSLAQVAAHNSWTSRALRVLYGQEAPSSALEPTSSDGTDLTFSSSSQLNTEQRLCISRCLASNDVFCIHGPPGCGKTTTIVELIVQCVARGERVLACAPSNSAVDNLVERIVKASSHNASCGTACRSKRAESKNGISYLGFDCIRAGHPARLLPSVLSHSLDAVVRRSDGAAVTKSVREDMNKCQNQLNKSRDQEERRSLRKEWRKLQGELSYREKKAVKDVLSATPVICSTLLGAANQSIQSFKFDTVIIDEAAQALEAACLIPALLCTKRLVLAGDHLQLGPVLKSKEALNKGIESVTLFDRLAKSEHRNAIFHLLRMQYRMNLSIMQWSSHEFYGDSLQGPEPVLKQRLTDLPDVKMTRFTNAPLVFIDTDGCEMHEQDEADDEIPLAPLQALSKSNRQEVDLVALYVSSLCVAGVRSSDVTILSPYLAQIQLLRDVLLPVHPGLEIGTIDSMQGREAECVIISLVRSNSQGEVGFLSDERRLNVAITRAKKQACLIGDSGTISRNAFLKRIVQYCSSCDEGEYVSAFELQCNDVNHYVDQHIQMADVQHEKAMLTSTKKHNRAKQEHQPGGSIKVEVEASSEHKTSEHLNVVKKSFERESVKTICLQVLASEHKNATYAFSSSLSNEERKLIHTVAEELGGLVHESRGSGPKRSLTISKMSHLNISIEPSEKLEMQHVQSTRLAAIDHLEASAKAGKSRGKITAQPSTLQRLITSQPTLTSKVAIKHGQSTFAALELEDNDDQRHTEENFKKETKQEKPQANKTARRSKLKPQASPVTEDDYLDSLMNEKGVKVCGFIVCQKKVSDYIMDPCPHCKLRFCFAHANGILHGCAKQIKENALSRDMKNFRDAQHGRQGLKDKERVELSKKLNEKIFEARKTHEKEPKNKKNGDC